MSASGSESDADDSYRTLAAPVRFEAERIKGSRFVGAAARATTAAEARALVESERERYADAGHHCFAWRLSRDPRDERSSDDGEPAGSAGPPILRQIAGRDLEGLVVVVTRWFGGVKLGVGGLIRAYGGTAAATLDAGATRVVVHTRTLELEHAYAAGGLVEALLRPIGGETLGATFGANVVTTVRVPRAHVEAFVRDFVDGTSGRGRVRSDEDGHPDPNADPDPSAHPPR